MRRSMTWFFIAGTAVVLALVLFVAPHADQNPDGLDAVAADHGLDAGTTHHDLAGSPLADYRVHGIDRASTGTALAGIVGVLLVFVVTCLLVRVAAAAARRRDGPRGSRDVLAAAPGPPVEP